MDYILAMTFLTEGGVKSTFSVSGVKPNLTGAQINTLMDTMIEKNIFYTKSGFLVKKSGAQLIEKNVTKIDIN